MSHNRQQEHTLLKEAVKLQSYLLLCRSVTRAQLMSEALERVGIYGRIFRPPKGLSEKGCSYALRIREDQFSVAISQIRSVQILPERVFLSDGNGAYREILLR